MKKTRKKTGMDDYQPRKKIGHVKIYENSPPKLDL